MVNFAVVAPAGMISSSGAPVVKNELRPVLIV